MNAISVRNPLEKDSLLAIVALEVQSLSLHATIAFGLEPRIGPLLTAPILHALENARDVLARWLNLVPSVRKKLMPNVMPGTAVNADAFPVICASHPLV